MIRFGRNLGLVAATALLASCGGGETEPAATDTTTTAEATPEPAAPASAAAEAPAADNTETTDGTQLANFTGTAEAGEKVFIKCQTCHVVEPGVNRIGPSLAGIVGREAGTVPEYQYSPANANSGITWTREKLFQYLENPQRIVPGTKMAFAGLPNAQDRADIIAFLESHSSQ
ncbi:hypothetical protein GCM10011371_22560 [Novosphingobium marinum]|uniref:Cytochrome c n=1 Tax=Novosphingobium marinum TaxID=1514948 RepID=A0A7Y9XXR6_9SPHN|nr:cytochrome c family protein [Novosphingobium marinum]NYH96370.1 cytochrome c [Novosphingobium marinum]GGC34699.1 hypothetical protein GCM10011371_22560 [Novosphingobium marinum]